MTDTNGFARSLHDLGLAAWFGGTLMGGALIVKANKGRIAGQAGVASSTGIKTVLTGAALAGTAASGVLGAKVGKAGNTPAHGATEPSTGTPDDVASAQKKLRLVQWVIPALLGAALVVSSLMGEQQRPGEVGSGLVERILPS